MSSVDDRWLAVRRHGRGMAFGSTFGALLEPFIGWRGIFLGTGLLNAGVLSLLWPYQRLLGDAPPAPTGTVRDLFAAYGSLLRLGRGILVKVC
jgi:predicted MFS family arabinose efflux permease